MQTMTQSPEGSRPDTMAQRIEEIDGLLAGIPDEAARQQAPGLWQERAQLQASVRRIADETEAIERARHAVEERRKRAEEFPAKLAAFQRKAKGLDRKVEDAANALLAGLDRVEALRREHGTLQAEARAAGLTAPSLARFAGFDDGRFMRLSAGAQYLRQG